MFSPSQTWYIGSYSLQAPLGRSGWRMCTASCWPRGDTPKPFQRPADTGRNSAPLIGLRKRRRRVIAGGSNSPGICAATGWHLIRDEYSNYFQLILYNQHTIINLVSVSAPTSPVARSENRWAQNQGDLGENLLRISGTVRYGSQLRQSNVMVICSACSKSAHAEFLHFWTMSVSGWGAMDSKSHVAGVFYIECVSCFPS